MLFRCYRYLYIVIGIIGGIIGVYRRYFVDSLVEVLICRLFWGGDGAPECKQRNHIINIQQQSIQYAENN